MTDLDPYVEPVAAIDVGIGVNRRPVDLASLMGLAQRIARVNEFVPSAFRGRPEAILAALLTGAELGLGPMQSLRSIHVIEGRPALSAEVMRALVLAHGHEIVVDESTDETCTVRGRRRDQDSWSNPITWTMDRARRAKLAGRQNWTNYPRQMLMARATGELCRTYFADIIGGLEAIESLDDDTPTNGPKPKTRSRKTAAVAAPELAAPEPQPEPSKPLEANVEAVPPPPEPDTPTPTVRKRAPRKPSPPEGGKPATSATTTTATEVVGNPDETAEAMAEVMASKVVGNPDETARRRLHAEIGETFPETSSSQRDLIRHALCILVTRLRPTGPITSSTELDDAERMLLSARLNEIRSGQLLATLTDDNNVELAAGPWRYYIAIDPPHVDVINVSQ